MERAEHRAAGRANGHGALGGGLRQARDARPDAQLLLDAAAEFRSAAAAAAAALEGRAEAVRRATSAWADVDRAARDAMNLSPKSYSNSAYWERRHAKSRDSGQTYEWYTSYPDEALRKVRQVSSGGDGAGVADRT